MDALKAFPPFPQVPFSGNCGNAYPSRDSRQPYRWRERRECREGVAGVDSRTSAAVNAGACVGEGLMMAADGFRHWEAERCET